MPQKKTTKRSRVKYPALTKKYNSRVKQELLEFDYLNQLSPSEMEWLNKFCDEYVNAAPVLDENKQLDPTKNIHQKPEHKKELYDANNRRNVDLFGLIKGRVANTKLLNYDDHINTIEQYLIKYGYVREGTVEDAWVEYLDASRETSVSEELNDADDGSSDGEKS